MSEFEPRRRRISFDYMSNRGRTKIKVLSAVVCNITDTTTTEVDNQTTRRGQVRKTTETAENIMVLCWVDTNLWESLACD